MATATGILTAAAAAYLYLQFSSAANAPGGLTGDEISGPEAIDRRSNSGMVVPAQPMPELPMPAVHASQDLVMRWLRQSRINEQLWDKIDPDELHRWSQKWWVRKVPEHHWPDRVDYAHGSDGVRRWRLAPQALPNQRSHTDRYEHEAVPRDPHLSDL